MSPILDIQRRFRELGRIRLGAKKATGKTYKSGPRQGQPIERPVKIATFRLTSPWGHLIEQAAEVFGGTAQEWSNDGAAEWEVFTDSKDDHGNAVLPCVIPPGEILDQWYELWSGGGCSRRCDGVRQVLVDRPCACPSDPLERQAEAADGKACKPTTRLRVMLPDVSDVGIWRLETHGFHAAAELGGAAGLVEAATRGGAMIPADLRLQPREGSRRPGEVRKKFFVPAISFRGALGPVLDALGILETGAEMPRILGVEQRPALTSGGSPALPPGTGNAFDPAPIESSSFPGPEPAPPAVDPEEMIDTGPVPVDEPDAFEPEVVDERTVEPDVATPEPEGFDPPPAPEEGEDGGPPGRSYTGPQIVAIRLGDLGVKDRAHKLEVVRALVGRDVESSKDLTPSEVRALLEDLKDLEPGCFAALAPKAKTEEAPASSSTEVAVETEVITPDEITPPAGARRRRAAAPDAPPSSVEPPSASSKRPEDWTGDDWRAFIAARGVKATEIVKAATTAANERGVPVPSSLDKIRGSGLEELLVGFVEATALERGGRS